MEFRLPDPGEGLTEAEIVSWHVAEGDEVKVNDIIVEIETSKSIVELPAPASGVIMSLLVAEGQTVDVGTPIVVIDDGTSAPSPDSGQAGADKRPESEDGQSPSLVGSGPRPSSGRRRARRSSTQEPQDPETTEAVNASYGQSEPSIRPDDVDGATAAVTDVPHGDPLPSPGKAPRGSELVLSSAPKPRLAKPPVRKLAQLLGIDLDQVTGTGPGGTITRADVEAAAALRSMTASGRVMPENSSMPSPSPEPEDFTQFRPAGFGDPTFDDEFHADPSATHRGSYTGAGDRREPIRGVRKVTAQAMVDSVTTHVHVTEWTQVDITATMELVERLKGRREFAGLRISPLLIVAKAVALAISATPVINASWDDEAHEIVYHGELNLGIAAATPRGLMVPNVKSAQHMTLLELCRAINHLVQVSKEGRLQPGDYAAGTFTITNVGVFGIESGTPIINRDESAILCMGAIDRRPWVVGTGADERIEPRWVSTLSISFDHRLIDGEQGSRFLHDVAEILQDPATALLF